MGGADRELENARLEAKETRKRVFENKDVLPANLHIRGVVFPLDEASDGVIRHIEYWRVPSLYHLREELGRYTSPYREWLDSEIDVPALLAAKESLTRLWFDEVEIDEAPRQWLRGAFELLQSYHRVTPGTPVDSQISCHLVDVDAVVSADQNFIKFAQKCRSDAPFASAQAHLLPGGQESVPALVALLPTLGSASA